MVKYHTTESINKSNEFFKRLYKSYLEEISTNQSLWEQAIALVKKNEIKKLSTGGIELGSTELNYYEEFKRVVEKVPVNKKIVFIIDEFSETLENIINGFGDESGRNFLHQNRELRQDDSIKNQITFVYSGSIGLGNIAERIDASKIINDIKDFSIPVLTEPEAHSLIELILDDSKIKFSDIDKDYFLQRIKWYIPYYIQIILDEIENQLIAESANEITAENIDQAFDDALAIRNYFEHWSTRLRTALKGDDYSYAKEVLSLISKSESGLSKTDLLDQSYKINVDDHQNIIRTLEYDGYIHLIDSTHYVFNSPLLKIWWERNISI
jgi:hypothetical protein